MRTLPTGSVEPNFGRRVRNRRQLNSLQNTWPYGYSMPIAVRYTQDFFLRAEDCIRVGTVTGVQTCALPILVSLRLPPHGVVGLDAAVTSTGDGVYDLAALRPLLPLPHVASETLDTTGRWCREGAPQRQIGRASCRERVKSSGGAATLQKTRE